jgi:hypothetical protein
MYTTYYVCENMGRRHWSLTDNRSIPCAPATDGRFHTTNYLILIIAHEAGSDGHHITNFLIVST